MRVQNKILFEKLCNLDKLVCLSSGLDNLFKDGIHAKVDYTSAVRLILPLCQEIHRNITNCSDDQFEKTYTSTIEFVGARKQVISLSCF